VTGSALWFPDPPPRGAITHAIGACAGWLGGAPHGILAAAVQDAMREGGPVLLAEGQVTVADRVERAPFAGVLPVIREGAPRGAALIMGPARAPFTALDQDFLLALGQQIGAALESADLDRRLRQRTAELERLSLRLIHQHEDQRRRLARELHDETAQVFSAMKLQVGLLREAGPDGKDRLEMLADLVDAGMESIRSVSDDLRPPLLDDLGMAPALQALVSDFRDRSGIDCRFDLAEPLLDIGDDAELALFRTLQEALANVSRHAEASQVSVFLGMRDGAVVLRVEDDGRGFDPAGSRGAGRMGLVGMEERLTLLGAALWVDAAPGRGVRLEARVPASIGEAGR
jgi:signal transduction histidine kinase